MSDLNNTIIEKIRYFRPPKFREGYIEVVEFESESDFNRKDRRLIAELRESHK